jgi:hypothetical protein
MEAVKTLEELNFLKGQLTVWRTLDRMPDKINSYLAELDRIEEVETKIKASNA